MNFAGIKVSLIIPVYNGEDFIREALDSVLSQTFTDFEAIVIDDGSNDRTLNILCEYNAKIKWKSKKHSGQASAINTALGLATGQYIALLDADDVCLPQRLEVQANYLNMHPDVGLVYSDRYQIDKHGNMVCRIESKKMDDFILLQENYIARSSIMVRRSCLETVGLFDEDNTGNDDWDMWVRISEKFEINYINVPLIKYRIHDKNISMNRPKKLNYFRWTRMRMLEKTYQRRGKPFWLKLLLLRSKMEWMIGRNTLVGERFASIWWRFHKMVGLLERLIILSGIFGNTSARKNLS